MAWTPQQMPDQTGRTVVVTGPTVGGLGYFTALALAARGARVMLAGRTPAKLDEARTAILAEHPDALLETLQIDLASFDSIRAAADTARALGPIDVLVNNAGVMATPYGLTVDGLEQQIGTNHYGPFLLTGLLLPQIAASGDGRVVGIGSVTHRIARTAPLSDPRAKPRIYSAWYTYAQTKLADILFTYELQRRLASAGLPVRALAAHPGVATTNLVANGPMSRLHGVADATDSAMRRVFQSPEQGAWPTLYAATGELPGASYVGPAGPFEASGPAKVVRSSALSRNRAAQHSLWELSERVTGMTYP